MGAQLSKQLQQQSRFFFLNQSGRSREASGSFQREDGRDGLPKKSYEETLRERFLLLQKNKVDQIQIQKQAKLECATYVMQQALQAEVQQRDPAQNRKSISNLVKVLNAIYYEYYKLATKYDHMEQLLYLAYELYNQKFGMKKLAENKLFYFFQEVRKYDAHPKIRQFARYLGLHSYSYNAQEVILYLNAQKHLCGNPGAGKQLIWAEDVQTRPEVIEESTPALFKDLVDARDISRIVIDLKQQDNMDTDHVVSYYLHVYRSKASEKIRSYQMLFDTMSDAHSRLTFQAFQILVKYIEPDKYSCYDNLHLFYRFCSELSDRASLNIFQFTEMCSQQNLFSPESQQRFIKQALLTNSLMQEENKIVTFAILKGRWHDLQRKYKLRFIQSKKYTLLHQLMIQKLDTILNHQTHASDQAFQHDHCFFLYKIIALESIQSVIDTFTDAFIPERLQELANIYNPVAR